MNIYLLVFKTSIILAFTSLTPTWAAVDNDPDLSISIGVPIHLDSRTIDLRSSNAHFHVLISKNIKKQARAWTKNFPDFVTLAPNQSLVFNVDFDSDVWNGFFRSNKIKSDKVSMRVIYASDETDKSKKHKVWSGLITSPLQSYIMKY